MAEQKVSRKALKTKKQIGTVLAELLQEKELRDIRLQLLSGRLRYLRTVGEYGSDGTGTFDHGARSENDV